MDDFTGYFSERALGPHLRVEEEIPVTAWDGIRLLISSRVEDRSFGSEYPEYCPDGDGGIIGVDKSSFWTAMKADLPHLTDYVTPSPGLGGKPPTPYIFDMIEFCYRIVHKPTEGNKHYYYTHLQFDLEEGQREFAESIERILSGNRLAYRLTDAGKIERVESLIIGEQIQAAIFKTGDKELDRLLEAARTQFFSHETDVDVRCDALKELWNAWERLKTLGGTDKKNTAARMVKDAAGADSPKFEEHLDNEAHELTKIGNDLRIRHTETYKEPIVNSAHVDYLFHRLFSFIWLVLETKEKQ